MPPTAAALSAELGLFLRPARRRLLRETFVLFLRLLSPHDPLALGSCGDLVGAHIARPPSSASVGADALIGPYDCTAEPAPWNHASPVRHAVRRDLLRGLLLGPAPLRCSPSAQALLPLLTTAQRFCIILTHVPGQMLSNGRQQRKNLVHAPRDAIPRPNSGGTRSAAAWHTAGSAA